MKDTIQFALREYESLRTEARDAVTESRTIERHSILVSGVVWGWLLTQPNSSPYIEYAQWIPFAISLLGALRSIALHFRLVRISEYIQEQEIRYGRALYFRWEAFLSKKAWVLTGTSVVFWIAIIGANSIAPRLINEHRASGANQAVIKDRVDPASADILYKVSK